MVRPTMTILAPACFLLMAAAAQAQVAPPPVPAPSAPAPSAVGSSAAGPTASKAPVTPSVAGAPPAPAAAPADAGETSSTGPRRTRSYARCNRSAQRLGFRGAERHRYVARCRLGYERPVVRP